MGIKKMKAERKSQSNTKILLHRRWTQKKGILQPSAENKIGTNVSRKEKKNPSSTALIP